jgi:hypothetical protein
VPVDVGKVPFAKDVNEWYLQATHEQVETFFKHYGIRQPAPIVDGLAAVREVFGSVKVVTNDPEYQEAIFA